MASIHSSAVAGQFYPAAADTLRTVVDGFLDSADSRPEGRVQAVIVPHAGYVFSGSVAAEAYAAISPSAEYDRIFLIGPSHREAFRGASVDVECDWYETPLGRLRVDTEAGFELIGADSIFRDFHNAHVREHCLEVQLPFLQERLREVPPIVPIIIGSVDGGGLRRIALVLGPYMNIKDPPTQVPKTLWCPSYPTTFPEQTATTSFTGTYTGTAGWANALSSSGGAYQGSGYYSGKNADGSWYGALISKLRGDLIIMTQMEPIWMSYNNRFGYNDLTTGRKCLSMKDICRCFWRAAVCVLTASTGALTEIS